MRNGITLKKIYAGSPEYEDANLSIVDATPQRCWDEFWKFAEVITAFSKGECDFFKPIDRSVVRKTYRSEKAAV